MASGRRSTLLKLDGEQEKKDVDFREILTMPNHSAQIGLDWEIPAEGLITKDIILKVPISNPIVLGIHGLN